jgi:hypothetical protein
MHLYKKLMFPPVQQLGNGITLPRTGWTMSQIDEMDVHFFNEVMNVEETKEPVYEKDYYLSDVW